MKRKKNGKTNEILCKRKIMMKYILKTFWNRCSNHFNLVFIRRKCIFLRSRVGSFYFVLYFSFATRHTSAHKITSFAIISFCYGLQNRIIIISKLLFCDDGGFIYDMTHCTGSHLCRLLCEKIIFLFLSHSLENKKTKIEKPT